MDSQTVEVIKSVQKLSGKETPGDIGSFLERLSALKHLGMILANVEYEDTTRKPLCIVSLWKEDSFGGKDKALENGDEVITLPKSIYEALYNALAA